MIFANPRPLSKSLGCWSKASTFKSIHPETANSPMGHSKEQDTLTAKLETPCKEAIWQALGKAPTVRNGPVHHQCSFQHLKRCKAFGVSVVT